MTDSSPCLPLKMETAIVAQMAADIFNPVSNYYKNYPYSPKLFSENGWMMLAETIQIAFSNENPRVRSNGINLLQILVRNSNCFEKSHQARLAELATDFAAMVDKFPLNASRDYASNIVSGASAMLDYSPSAELTSNLRQVFKNVIHANVQADEVEDRYAHERAIRALSGSFSVK